jgi:hypothetical protein
MAASLGKIPTTSVRRLILPLRRSTGFLDILFDGPWGMKDTPGHRVQAFHEGGELGDPTPQLACDLTPMRLGAKDYAAAGGCAHDGRDDPALGLSSTDEGVSREGRDPLNVASWITVVRAFSVVRLGSRKALKMRPFAKLRDSQLHLSRSRLPVSISVAIALRQALRALLPVGRRTGAPTSSAIRRSAAKPIM